MTEKTFLTLDELRSINLPKWPGCDVDGDRVTVEQAREILVRTSGYHFFTNDREFEQQVSEVFYSAISHPEWGEKWWEKGDIDYNLSGKERMEQFNAFHSRRDQYREELGMLDIEYLDNQRVCSSYIGGPNGWCDWTGEIFQRGKNIGKWPSAIEVFNEWKAIAREFPFLNLTCKLLSHEAGYHEEAGYHVPSIAVVYEVSNGQVNARLPEPSDHFSDKVTKHKDEGYPLMFFARSERGTSIEYWRQACNEVAQKMKGKTW
jgi:hypothetical protein